MTFEPQLRRQATWLGGLMMLSALSEGVGLVLLVPLLELATGGQGPASTIGLALARLGFATELGPLLTTFITVVLLRGVINLMRAEAAMRFEIDLVDVLRKRAWQALLHADWRMLTVMRRSASASLLVTSLERVGWGLAQLIATLGALTTLAGLALAALAIAPLVAIAAVIGGLVVLLAYRRLRRRAATLGVALDRDLAEVHGLTDQNLAALRTIKSLHGEARAAGALATAQQRLAGGRLRFVRDKALGNLVLQGGGAVILGSLVWLAVEVWSIGAAVLLPMIALFARALPLLGMIQESWQSWAHARPALVAAQDLIAKLEAAHEDDEPGIEPPDLTTAISLEQVLVEFGEADEPALDHVSLAIPAGSILALVGGSGAGKSTIADLLSGLIAPDSGQVTIDGQPLDHAARRAWRGSVAYVEQEPLVLAASLRENLTWPLDDVSDARIWTALEGSALADFVRALPQELDTQLGDGGRRLSGGERQRLMLARALLRDPQLLILDEATSALDADNEAAIAAALAGLRGRMTIVLIAHRGALLDLADRVIRLERGRVVDES